MFDIGWSELVLIGVIALIVIGPKELPGVLRMVGQWTGKIRRMAAEFQGQFNEALREAEMADLKKQVEDINETARSIARFDPLADRISKPATSPDASAPADAASPPLPPVNDSAPAAVVETPVPPAGDAVAATPAAMPEKPPVASANTAEQNPSESRPAP